MVRAMAKSFAGLALASASASAPISVAGKAELPQVRHRGQRGALTAGCGEGGGFLRLGLLGTGPLPQQLHAPVAPFAARCCGPPPQEEDIVEQARAGGGRGGGGGSGGDLSVEWLEGRGGTG